MLSSLFSIIIIIIAMFSIQDLNGVVPAGEEQKVDTFSGGSSKSDHKFDGGGSELRIKTVAQRRYIIGGDAPDAQASPRWATRTSPLSPLQLSAGQRIDKTTSPRGETQKMSPRSPAVVNHTSPRTPQHSAAGQSTDHTTSPRGTPKASPRRPAAVHPASPRTPQHSAAGQSTDQTTSPRGTPKASPRRPAAVHPASPQTPAGQSTDKTTSPMGTPKASPRSPAAVNQASPQTPQQSAAGQSTDQTTSPKGQTQKANPSSPAAVNQASLQTPQQSAADQSTNQTTSPRGITQKASPSSQAANYAGAGADAGGGAKVIPEGSGDGPETPTSGQSEVVGILRVDGIAPIVIRKARPADVDEIIGFAQPAYMSDPLRADLIAGSPLTSVRMTERGLCKQMLLSLFDGTRVVLVGEITDRTGGSKRLIACFQLYRQSDNSAYFGMFAVHAFLQKYGLGKRFLTIAEHYARDVWKSDEMHLDVGGSLEELKAGMGRLQRYYVRRGFRSTGIRRPFRGEVARFIIVDRDDLCIERMIKDIRGAMENFDEKLEGTMQRVNSRGRLERMNSRVRMMERVNSRGRMVERVNSMGNMMVRVNSRGRMLERVDSRGNMTVMRAHSRETMAAAGENDADKNEEAGKMMEEKHDDEHKQGGNNDKGKRQQTMDDAVGAREREAKEKRAVVHKYDENMEEVEELLLEKNKL